MIRILIMMKFYFLIPILVAFSCKANNESSTSSDQQPQKSEVSKSFVGLKDPEPIMGGPLNISIKVNDIPAGTARIIGFYSDQNFLVDSITFSNNMISYKKSEGLPQGLYYLGFMGRNEIIQIMLGKDQEFEMSLNAADPVNTCQIIGSDENKLMYENMKYESVINPQLQTLAEQMKSVQKGSGEYKNFKVQKDKLENERLAAIKSLYDKNPDLLYPAYKFGGQNPRVKEDLPESMQVTQFRKDFWNNVNFKDTRLLRTPMIGNKLKKYMKDFTAQNQDSILVSGHDLMKKVINQPEYYKIFANWIVLNYEPTKCNLMDAEAVFVGMVQNYFTKEKAYWQDTLQTKVIQQRAAEMSQSLIGKKAPNVISKDQNGSRQELYTKTADYVVVYLYNPDCEHCQEQTPKLYKLYKDKAGELDVFAIAIETDDKKWKEYITKNGLSWTNVYDPTNKSIYGKYWVDVTPEIYVMNKEKVLIGKNLKVDQIQTVINSDKKKRGIAN